ncbi:MAG: mechanosensitive ion channel family protein [Myxococcota bacterium]
MQLLLDQLREVAFDARLWAGVRAVVILAVGLLASRLVRRRLPVGRLHPQHRLLFRRLIAYAVLGVSVAWALQELGVRLGVLLGAAGVLTVAAGFAAQTSASNLISGLFLMGEQPFRVGDVIQLGETVGEVVSVDLLSVRLRTFDNLLVRIPNESVLRSNVTNLTHFPVRRLDMKIGVAYKEDLRNVREVLLGVADGNPLCLEEPRALMIVRGFGDSSIELQFSVWATQANFLELRNSMYEGVKRAFDDASIEIPFPHRTLYGGSGGPPIRVEMA